MSTKNNALAILPPPVVFTVERPIDAIRADFIVEGTTVLFKKGAKITVDELAFLVNEDMKDSESKTVRLANQMRLARMLPDVEVEGKKTPAFEYVKARVKQQIQADGRSEGAFYTTFQLVDAIDVIEANQLKSSPTNVKDAMAALRKSEALAKGGDLKLKASKASALVKALKEGATQAKVREIVDKMGTTKKTAKKKTATPPADDTTKVKQTVDGIKASLVSVRGQWELGITEGLNVEDIRKACRDEVQILAKLAGWDVIEFKSAPAKK